MGQQMRTPFCVRQVLCGQDTGRGKAAQHDATVASPRPFPQDTKLCFAPGCHLELPLFLGNLCLGPFLDPDQPQRNRGRSDMRLRIGCAFAGAGVLFKKCSVQRVP